MVGGLIEEVPQIEEERFQPKVYRSSDSLAVVAPTFLVSPKFTFVDFLGEYGQNPGRALRDYGSVPSFSVEAFFRDPTLLERMVNEGRVHPLNEDGSFRDNFFPKPRKHYYLHIDLSRRRDATGIAMAHWDRDALRDHPVLGLIKGLVVVDFMLQIPTKPGTDIDFERIRQIAYNLKLRGFHLKQVSYDQYQSADSQQQLIKKGITAVEFSVDRNTAPYDTMQELMISGRLDYYRYPIFFKECRELELKDGRKVDHPPKGSKDVADGVAAVSYHALLEAANEPVASSSTMSHQEASIMEESPGEQKKRTEILGFRDSTDPLLY